jgi:oxygen-dependent protoporphyrinogen oxidase
VRTSPADPATGRLRVAVVGGGIAGLAAALTALHDGADVTLVEGATTAGGKLRVGELAGVPVDEGAESFLLRAPEVGQLAAELGLSADLVTAAPLGAGIWTRGRLRRLPRGTLMGVPTRPLAVARSGVLGPGALARAGLDLLLPRTHLAADVSVGGYVRARLGREVVDRLVDPLLGGVYAGRADALSLAATLPQLGEAARRERSLIRLARGALPPTRPGPVFGGLRGGLGRLAEAAAGALSASGGTLLTGRPVRELRRRPDGWQLVHGSTTDVRTIDADRVVLAVPAAPAARLLAGVVPAAARELATVEYASVALVSLVFAAPPPAAVLRLSGYLVPAVEHRTVKAVTFLSTKWPWLAELQPGLFVVRCSVGRHGDTHDLQRDDDELVALARAELGGALGLVATPVAARVSRWGGALPQYTVGHVDRVTRLRAALRAEPTLAVAGAVYDGVGVPACIRSGRSAAETVMRR